MLVLSRFADALSRVSSVSEIQHTCTNMTCIILVWPNYAKICRPAFAVETTEMTIAKKKLRFTKTATMPT